MPPPVKLGQGVVFRPGTAHDERWAPNQFLSGFVTSIAGDDASIVVFPDVYAPFYEMRVKRDDSLSEDRTWTPSVGEDQEMPEAPSDGQIYGRRNQAWTPISGEDQGYLQAIIISDTAPLSGLPGMAWFDTTINNFYVFEQGKWVEPAHVNPPEELSTNIVAPLIIGIIGIGEVITCTPGNWTSNPFSYLFQWYRGGSAIVGQTLSTYTISALDVDQLLSCSVAAMNVIGVSQQVLSNVVSVTAPTNALAPAIEGAFAVGAVWSCTTGSWTTSSSIASFAYQWYRGAAPIAGATAATYTLAAEDNNTDLSCRVVATNAVGPSLPAGSNSAAIRSPAIIKAPYITGQVGVGLVLSCSTGDWNSSPISFTYEWRRGGVAIGSATNNTYTLVAGDVANIITCVVIATNAVGSSLPATSNSVLIDAPTIRYAPVISGGILFTGTTLTCSTGVWYSLPTSFAYQWRQNGAPIGAASNQYVLTWEDLGTNITCDVVSTNGIGASAPATSNSLIIQTATAFDPATLQDVTLSANGLGHPNLRATHSTDTTAGARSISYKASGKWCFECDLTNITGNNTGIGLLLKTGVFDDAVLSVNSVGLYGEGGAIYADAVYSGKSLGGLVSGDDIHIAVDLDNGLIWFRRNNEPWNGDSTAVPGTSGGVSFTPGLFSPVVFFGGLGTSIDENTICNFGSYVLSFSVAGFVPGWPV